MIWSILSLLLPPLLAANHRKLRVKNYSYRDINLKYQNFSTLLNLAQKMVQSYQPSAKAKDALAEIEKMDNPDA
jgi:hypothetical protein